MVEKVAGMSEECPNWGMLDEIGLTDDVLREVVVNDSLPVNYSDSSSLPDLPSHGILIELYYFCQRFSALSKSKVNFILKKCIDVLFPLCVVSQADRLERRIQDLCLSGVHVKTGPSAVFAETLEAPANRYLYNHKGL